MKEPDHQGQTPLLSDSEMSEEEKINGEFAKKVLDAVLAFAVLDATCDKLQEIKIKGKTACDRFKLNCDDSCNNFVKRYKLASFIEKALKATPSTVAPVKAETLPEPVPEMPAPEKRCPSCGVKAARPDSKYCDYCGDEF